MGDRWVSPVTYTRVADGPVLTLEVKAEGLGMAGQPVGVAPAWTAADPGMIGLAHGGDGVVRITVQRPGQSTLSVAARGVSQQLLVTAEYLEGALVARISRAP
jgi:hypothetical protein